jgi:hypothetical protein
MPAKTQKDLPGAEGKAKNISPPEPAVKTFPYVFQSTVPIQHVGPLFA